MQKIDLFLLIFSTLTLLLQRYQVVCITKGYKNLLFLCEEAADFRNGVTDPNGQIDEGVVLAGRTIREAKRISRIRDYA